MADYIAPLAVLPLTYGATVVAEALDPSTFAAVSGVVVSEFTIYAIDSGTDAGSSQPAEAPLWVPIPLEDQ